MDGDVLGSAAGLEKPTALKYLHEVVFAMCSKFQATGLAKAFLTSQIILKWLELVFKHAVGFHTSA